MKKTIFAIVASLLVLAQIHFIVWMRFGFRQLLHVYEWLGIEPTAYTKFMLTEDGLRQLSSMYKSLGVKPTAYTKFMFAHIDLWWILPFLCGLLVYWTFRRWSWGRAVITLLTMVVCYAVLFWSAYSPFLAFSM
ncbi:MAG: hypothetical protein LBQ62_06745 [Candidatus Accumulibacter sp.]|nr:hypothetical protein [Accumulibacter sp.]